MKITKSNILITICNLIFLLRSPLWSSGGGQDIKRLIIPVQNEDTRGSAWPCGFVQTLILKHQWDRLRPEITESLARPADAPPMVQDSTLSPSGRFMLHYDRTGGHAVPAEDISGNGIPDYIDSAGVILDYVWEIEVDSLGFDPPLNIQGQPVTLYHVYFQDLFGFYGNAYSDLEIPGNSEAHRYTSYIVLENDYTEGDFYVKGLDALKVTAAHEFNHAIQLSCGVWWEDAIPVDVYLMEMTATWVEDVVYEGIDRYIDYLPDLFYAFSNTTFTQAEDLYPYGNSLFLHMLEKIYGAMIVSEIWGSIKTQIGILAIQEVLSEYGTSLSTQLHQYGIWLYFTGDRNDSVHYFPEGQSYPQLRIAQEDRHYYLNGLELPLSVNSLACRYLQISVLENRDYTSRTLSTASNLRISHISDGQVMGPMSPGQQMSIYFDKNDPVRVLITNPNTQVVEAEYRLSTESVDTPVSVSVYPNPINLNNHDLLTIDNVPEGGHVYIYTTDGNAITTISILPNATNGFWDLTTDSGEQISSGIYLYLVKGGDTEKVGKIMVIR